MGVLKIQKVLEMNDDDLEEQNFEYFLSKIFFVQNFFHKKFLKNFFKTLFSFSFHLLCVNFFICKTFYQIFMYSSNKIWFRYMN